MCSLLLIFLGSCCSNNNSSNNNNSNNNNSNSTIEIAIMECYLLPQLCSTTTKYVQILLSSTSRLVVEADAVAAIAATEINHQAKLKLLIVTVAAVTMGGHWSILLSLSLTLWEHPPANPTECLENSLRWTP